MLQKTIKWICVVSVCFLFCSPKDFVRPNQVDIDRYLQDHPDLPSSDKTCLEDGRFEIGITQETLLFLLKEPQLKETIKQPWALQEKWIYKKRGHKVFIIEDKHVVGILENN